MNDIKIIHERAEKLKTAMLDVQQPRSNYALEHFVKGLHDTPGQQYLQVMEELRRCYIMIRKLILDKEKIILEIEQIRSKARNRIQEIDAEIKEVDLEEIEASLIGKVREFNALYNIYTSMPKYTREQIEAEEPEYWAKRLTRQAGEDKTAIMTGVSRGSLDALWQAKMMEAPRMDMDSLPENLKMPSLEHKE